MCNSHVIFFMYLYIIYKYSFQMVPLVYKRFVQGPCYKTNSLRPSISVHYKNVKGFEVLKIIQLVNH